MSYGVEEDVLNVSVDTHVIWGRGRRTMAKPPLTKQTLLLVYCDC
jgi:hypothetical protein